MSDDEYRYSCSECGHNVETGQWRESVDCPECSTGKLVSDESQDR